MTLFEALVALVVLSLAAVGFLGAFQGAARSTRDAADWVQAVSYAEASVEETKLGPRVLPTLPESLPGGFVRVIDVEAWAGAPGLERVVVTVGMPGGRTFTLHRLVRVP